MKTITLTVAVFSLLALVLPSVSYAKDNDTNEGNKGGVFQFLNKVGKSLQTRAAIGSSKVSSIGSTSLVVSKDGKDITVNFDSNTKFRRRFWGVSQLSEIQVGDTVNVIGKWTDDSHTAINAVLIRDLSIEKRFGIFFGTVTSLTSNGWMMSTMKRGNQTITVTTSTKFVNRKGETISQSDVKVGDRVRVKGLWDKTNSTVTEVTNVKDFGVPTPAASPSEK